MAEDYERARALVLEHQKVSASWLQRQLRIGYNAAARHIEQLEREGFISAADHIGRRTVLRPFSATVEGTVEPWSRNEGKFDRPSSSVPVLGVHAQRLAKGWTPPAPFPAASAEPVPLDGAERSPHDIAADLVRELGVEGARRVVRAAAEAKGEVATPKVATPAEDWLRRIVERALELRQRQRDAAADVRDLWAFAKDIGFHPPALKAIVKTIEEDKDKRFDREANIEIYRAILGIEGPDFVIELPAPAAPAEGKARKISARDRQLSEALALSAAATIDQ